MGGVTKCNPLFRPIGELPWLINGAKPDNIQPSFFRPARQSQMLSHFGFKLHEK